MSELNIYQRMSAITAEITAVAKNLNVGFGQSQYKATGEADVLAAVKPIEAKHGVYSYPYKREIIESAVLTSVDSRGNERKQQFMRVMTVYRFVNVDKPDEYIDITSYGDGVDPQDKAPGKSCTYSDKYALLKAYKIITGEDPDQYMSEELKGKAEKPQKPVRATKKAEPKDVTPLEGEPVRDAMNAPDGMTDEERMMAAYPPREEMIAICREWVKGKALANTLTTNRVADIADLSNAALITLYNWACKIAEKTEVTA